MTEMHPGNSKAATPTASSPRCTPPPRNNWPFTSPTLWQAMRGFGSKVTIVERNSRLAHREDAEISEALHELCQDEGVDVVTRAHVTGVQGKSGEQVNGTVPVMARN